MVRTYPYPIPGQVEQRTPIRYLAWLARLQSAALIGGVLCGSAWMLAQALMPLVLGLAIDQGIVAGDFAALLGLTGVTLALGLVQAIFAVGRHRLSVGNWLQGSFRSIEVLGRKIARTGDALSHAISTGDVMSTASSDATRIGQFFDTTARLSGAILSYIVVTVLIWRIHLGLGLTVLLGVPVCCGLILLVIRPMHRRQAEQREMAGKMTAIGADTVTGLRVLRGIGGERIFVNRYKERSQLTRFSGNQVARSIATMDGTEILVTGAFSVVFTWIGAALALDGSISTGQLVSLYGFSVFLLTPVRTFTDALNAGIRSYVGSRKVLKILHVPAEVSDLGQRPAPAQPAPLRDSASGVVLHPATLTAVVSADPNISASVAERLGRFNDADLRAAPVLWGDLPLTEIPLNQVRQRIVLSGADPQLFSGTLRGLLDPRGAHSDAEITQALLAASAQDVLDGVAEGLDHEVTEKGRGFSGGQRQRLALARVLLTGAEALLLVEPTSAVDAHTEARIAANLQRVRAQKATLVTTASPLLLGKMDEVLFLREGRVAARGTHRELLTNPEYRSVVIRGE